MNPPTLPHRKPSKYRNVRTAYGGRTYDSKSEAARAATLDILRRAGEIRHWEPQPSFRLGNQVLVYRADFLVWNLDGSTHAEDVKGTRTAKFNRDVKLWIQFGPCELHIIGKGGRVDVVRPEWMEG